MGVGTIGASGSMSDLDAADIHNHPPQNNMPIFSFNDLVSFYDSYTYVKPSRKKMYTSYLVNFNGTTYALKMDDPTALDALFDGMNIGTATTTVAQRDDARKEMKKIFKQQGQDDYKTYNQADAEKLFMKVINDPKIGSGNGVHIYRKDTDGWGKLNMDANGNITKENCSL